MRRLTAPARGDRAPAVVGGRRARPYIDGQLKAIVGVEIVIDRVEGKWKLSQNRSDADITGAIEGLEATGERGVSAAMREPSGAEDPPQPLKTRWTSLRPVARASMSSRVV